MMAREEPKSRRYGKPWSREEHVLAFNLYSQLPFGKLHHRNPRIVGLAKLLGRTPDAVAMKLCNLARFDPDLQERGIAGLSKGAKSEEAIWVEFKSNPEGLAFESEKLMAQRRGTTVEVLNEIETSDLPPEGREREAVLRVRVNQNFFRKRILSAYEFKCCITGLSIPGLLVASHIVPWADDPTNRLNPKNGLCLNALHDRAFDRHLMWIDEDYKLHFSAGMKQKSDGDSTGFKWLVSFEGKRIISPTRMLPDQELLRRHRSCCE